MPHKPKRPCSYPGCPRLTDGRYCAEHAKLEAKQYEMYKRDPETRKRYGTEWRKVRARYLQVHPLCEMCKAEGKLTPTEHIHHKTPLSEGGTNNPENLMALCRVCHAKLHAERGDRWH